MPCSASFAVFISSSYVSWADSSVSTAVFFSSAVSVAMYFNMSITLFPFPLWLSANSASSFSKSTSAGCFDFAFDCTRAVPASVAGTPLSSLMYSLPPSHAYHSLSGARDDAELVEQEGLGLRVGPLTRERKVRPRLQHAAARAQQQPVIAGDRVGMLRVGVGHRKHALIVVGRDAPEGAVIEDVQACEALRPAVLARLRLLDVVRLLVYPRLLWRR